MLPCAVSDAETLPGCDPLLATVADYRPVGDSVAVPHLPAACAPLPHVRPTVSNSHITYSISIVWHVGVRGGGVKVWRLVNTTAKVYQKKKRICFIKIDCSKK